MFGQLRKNVSKFFKKVTITDFSPKEIKKVTTPLKDILIKNEIAVATRGLFIVTAAGDVVAGRPVSCTGGDAVEPWPAGNADASGAMVIGRALTAAGSEGYCIISLTC